MPKNKIKIWLAVLVGFGLLLQVLPLVVSAEPAADSCATSGNTLPKWGCDPRAQNLGLYVQGIFNFSIYVLAIASFGVLLFGGYMYMFSGLTESKKKGIEYIRNAIIGLIVGLLSYLGLNTLDNTIIAALNTGAGEGLLPPLSTFSGAAKAEAPNGKSVMDLCVVKGSDPFLNVSVPVPDFRCGWCYYKAAKASAGSTSTTPIIDPAEWNKCMGTSGATSP